MRARTLVAAILAAFSLTACASRERSSVNYVPGDTYGTPDATQAMQPGADEQPQTAEPAPLWPRVFTSGDTGFATYEPIIESWTDEKLLRARVAVEVYPPGAPAPKYGQVWFEAPTQTDRAQGVVTLGDVRITRARFPTAKDQEASYVQALRGAELPEARDVAIDRLQRQVQYGSTQPAVPAAQAVNKDPPAILVTDRPTTLVQVDGAPRLRNDGGVQRVINTRALLFSDSGAYFVWVGDRWYRAPKVDGNYVETRDVPPGIEAARGRLATSRDVDLFADATERGRDGMKVVVATRPTEVIETRGAPVYERIPGTSLTYLANSDDDVLREDANGQVYVLVGGRWFRGSSLGSGPWTFVAGKDLPATFKDIPRDHREARVLASIPETPEAEEAAIAAAIPQTAVVDRAHAQLAVAYDGEPDFQPVQGASAPIQYAVNADTPVIAASDGMYYAVENGVWFVASSPRGPWTVATSVPDVIYSIPQSSPIHYVTYVRIYGYSPDYAYVGYMPGYLGAYYTDGVVVVGGFGPWWYGPAGYYGYSPWVGHVWGRPSYWRGGWRGPSYVAGGSVYRRWGPSVAYAPPAQVRGRVSAPAAFPGARGRFPASPSVGPRTSAPTITGAPMYVPRSQAPAYATPRTTPPSFAPRTTPPIYATPRSTPPSFTPRSAPPPSFMPRSTPPSFTPRSAPPPSFTPRSTPPSFAPHSAAPPPVFRGSPGGAARAAPPSFSAPAAPGGGASRGGHR